MAYDAGTSYVAPGRAYYAQSPEESYLSNGYARDPRAQYNDYDVQSPYDDDPPQNHNDPYGASNAYQDIRPAQQPQTQQYSYGNGYGELQRDEREQELRQPDKSGTQPSYNDQSNDSQHYNTKPARRPAPPRVDQTPDYWNASQEEKRSDPVNNSIGDWKAQEKARMHAGALSPETLAQDNAFPVFPISQDRSKARNSGDRTASSRENVPRPGTSSGNRHERKSSKSKAFSDNAPDPYRQANRPPLGQKAHSAEQAEDRGMHQPSSSTPYQQQPPRTKYHVSNPDIPSEQRMSPPSYQPEQHYALPSAYSERRPSDPQASTVSPGFQSHYTTNGQDHIYAKPQPHQFAVELSTQSRTPRPSANMLNQQSQPASQNGQYDQLSKISGQPMQSQYQSRAAPLPQAIDTNQAHQYGRAYDQPRSAGPIPQRPSTSHGSRRRSPQPQYMTSPTSAYPPAQTLQQYDRDAASQQSRLLVEQRPRVTDPDDIYGHYLDSRVKPPVIAAAPQSRDEEIEAEMPDFDSAAPGGTSMLHKRSQRNQNPARSAVPPSAASTAQNMQYQSNGATTQQWSGYDRQPVQMSNQPPTQRGPVANMQNGMVNGQQYGPPVQSNPRAYGAPYESVPQSQSYPQLPPQPPFAHEQPRRSMDDGRQMPHRQGPPPDPRFQTNGQPPPQQRIAGNGQPPRGDSGQPKQGPGQYTNFNGPDLSVQTSWSVPPPQERIGSAPPTQQSFSQPPPNGYGKHPKRQNTMPEQPGPQQHVPQQRRSDPDSLPQHPVPIRPGHMGGPGQPAKPPPVRNHDNVPAKSHKRQPSSTSSRPVTVPELDQLRVAVDSKPNDQKRALLLVKKLVEAADVLASDGGRADPRTQAQNRERYTMEADKRLKKLISAGSAEAQFYLADCYGQGTMGLPINLKEAFTLYQAAAKAGHAEAAYRTAMCCELGPEDGGTSKDYGKAVQWYRRGAALGSPDAMFKIGIILLKGLLAQQRNIGEAVNFIKRAAEQSGHKNPHALFELAQLYESTQENPEIRNKVVADDRYAFELFKQAAEAGHKTSQFRLGQAYEYGNLGAPIDNKYSITWYTKAAAQGEHQAELALSGWYLTGSEGILQQSDQEAYLWARKAAVSEPPLGKAMFAMGYFTETGIGCPKNIEEAKKWYAKAATFRFPKAAERLDELRRSGSKVSKPVNGKLSRKDQKRDEENCVVS